jgi:hypothetical protein
MSFSPFRSDSGEPLDLDELRYEDLSQLKSSDEGFALEFKQVFDDHVREKVPKIIASFSNSKGGWLVIGIRDTDHAVTPIPRGKADYSQTIGELCRHHVSPTPRFDMRFLESPEGHDEGVLVIRVQEGDYPPYVADGIVEVRVGSSSAPADGTSLVDLYDKSARSKAAVSAFCRRSVYYPADEGPSGGLPLFDLYLYHLGHHSHRMPSHALVNERARAMRACFGRIGLSFCCQHAHDSLIFRTTLAGTLGEPHSAIELFGDGSMKLTVPAVLLQGEEREDAVSRLAASVRPVPDPEARNVPDDGTRLRRLERSRIMSASDTLTRVTRMATVLDHYMRDTSGDWGDYALAYELESLAGVLVFSSRPGYLDYVSTHGVLCCGTTDGASAVRYVDEMGGTAFQVHQFAGSRFFEACGLPLGSDDPEDAALVRLLLQPERG